MQSFAETCRISESGDIVVKSLGVEFICVDNGTFVSQLLCESKDTEIALGYIPFLDENDDLLLLRGIVYGEASLVKAAFLLDVGDVICKN